MKKITTIIFDWGSVLTKGRHSKTVFRGLSKHRRISNRVFPPFKLLVAEMANGKYTQNEFVRTMNSRFGWSFTPQEVQDAFLFAIRPNRGVISLAERLGKNYRLAILSNNDPITVNHLTMKHPDLFRIFPRAYFSHLIKISKPEPGIFKHALKELRTPAAQCVFIDDKKRNVDAAKKLGMHGLVFTSATKLKKDLLKLRISTN